MSTLQEKWQTKPINGSFDIFVKQLSKLRVIDIGRVSMILNNGSIALVELLDGSQTRLKCEVVSIGVGSSSMQAIDFNQYVLVVYPCTPLSMIHNGVDLTAQAYSPQYAKCIPLGTRVDTVVDLNMLSDSVSIASDNYDIVFGEDSIYCIFDNMRLSVNDTNASITIGKNTINMNDNKIEIIVNGVYDAQGALTSCKNKLVMNKTDGMSITGDITIDGAMTVTGDFSAANGNLTAEV